MSEVYITITVHGPPGEGEVKHQHRADEFVSDAGVLDGARLATQLTIDVSDALQQELDEEERDHT